MKRGFEVFKDGVNLRERKVKRGYLRQEEMNQIMMLGATHQLLMGMRSLTGVGDCVPIWEKFQQSGIITKEQIKCQHHYPLLVSVLTVTRYFATLNLP